MREEVQDEQREQAGAAQLGDKRVLRAGAARPSRPARLLERRGLRDGAFGRSLRHSDHRSGQPRPPPGTSLAPMRG
jgi:hypothetical protein